MDNTELHAIPADPRVPYPVDLGRLSAAISQFGTLEPLASLSSATIHFCAEEERFVSSFDSSGRYLSVRRTWNPDPSFLHRRGPILVAVDNWNRTRYYPTVYLSSASGSYQVVADATIDVRHGLSESQLDDFLLISLSTCSEAIDFVSWSARKILSLDPPPRDERL